MKAIGPLLIFLLLPFAGCVGGASPCTFVIAHPTVGSHFLYEAEGHIRTYTVNAIGEWPSGSNAPDLHGSLELPSGSRVEIAVSQQTSPRLSFNGTVRPAYQITYWAERPDVSAPLAWSDEWLSADRGQVIQATGRAMRVEGNLSEHFTSFGEFDSPGALFTSVLWGKKITQGSQAEHSVPSPEVAPRIAFPNASFNWHVESLSPSADGCMATLFVSYSLNGYPGSYEGRMELAEGVAFPTFLSAGAKGYSPAFTLRMVEHQQGSGPSLPSMKTGQVEEHPTGRAIARAFPGGPHPEFPTSLDEAVTFARQQSDIKQWLEAHPAAKLGSVTRLPGAPGSTTRDGWTLLWQDGDEHSRVARISNRTATLPLLEKEGLHYESVPAASPGTATNLDQAWLRLATLMEMYEAHYGSAPEVVDCGAPLDEAAEATCQFGSVAGMGRNYAGEASGGSFRPGLWISPHRGTVHQDNSYDDRSLGPPVAHRLL